MKILVRGDCCSRRAIAMNSDVFGGRPTVIANEKARTDFFAEHARVGSPTPEDVEHWLDVDAMSKSLRHYAIGQTDRATLEERDADLIVMDNYSDMNFQAWRSREHGWKLWIHPKFVRDQKGFDKAFDRLGYIDYDESLRVHVELIERYREINGPIPVLYLEQPIAFYPRLEPREAFGRLGTDLERLLPDVYAGVVPPEGLEPDDVGSCGPGMTLHFTGPTYRRMIDQAMEKGLAECLRRTRALSPS